jgi:PAS domain S-box-containing protein
MTAPTPTMNPANQVSCHVLGVFLDICDQYNITDDVLVGSKFDRAYLNNSSNFIDWDSLTVMTNRLADHFMEQELLEICASSYKQPRFTFYRLMGRLRFTLPHYLVYLAGPDGAVPNFYPIDSELLNYDIEQRNITFGLTLRKGLTPCPNFFKIIEGQFIGIPEMMGFSRAHVDAIYTDRGVTISIDLPVESGLFPLLRKVLMFPFDLWSSVKTLQLTHDVLIKRNRELEQETRKLSEAKSFLRVQKKQLGLLDQNQAMLFWTLDLNLEPLYFSESVKDLTGYTAEEALMLPALGLMHESSREEVFVTLATYLEKEQKAPFRGSVSIRIKQQRKDKTTFWSANYVTFLRDNNDKAIGITGVTVDIDDTVKNEERQKSLENDLQEARQRELVGRVAGGVAHDFNNSLQTIIGYSELLENEIKTGRATDDYVIQSSKQILKSATSASELVRQLLALGRRQTLTLETFDIGKWLNNLEPLIHTILDSSIALTMDIPGGLTVEGDRSQLERVIANLTLNAKDAMPSGGQFRITARQQDGHIEMVFSDNGSGIPESILPQIFEPFFTSKSFDQGSGLGLAVSAGIIEQHKGEIIAQSQEGYGASIRIRLPVATGETVLLQDSRPEIPELEDESTILLVDDRTVIRELVISMSLDQPLKFIEAKDGLEAVEQFRIHQDDIDLILMDIVMPNLNGDAAAARIKEINPNAPIIFMTGYAGDLTDLSAIQSETVLAKPFNRRNLLSTLFQHLSDTKKRDHQARQHTAGGRS